MKKLTFLIVLFTSSTMLLNAHGEPEATDASFYFLTAGKTIQSKMFYKGRVAVGANLRQTCKSISPKTCNWRTNTNEITSGPSNILCRSLKLKFRVSPSMNFVLSLN